MNVIKKGKRLHGLARLIFLLSVMLLVSGNCDAQLAIKTNLLYDATTTPNLGAEFGVGPRSTVSVVYGLNPWTFGSGADKRKTRHWVVMPEYRWWPCSKFDGHFFGIHAMGGQMNMARLSIPFPGAFFAGDNITSGLRHHRYQGWFAGGGVTYGYQWVLGRHWNFEAEIGAGYNYVKYKKFNCADCGGKVGEGHTNYLGITKLGLSFIYLF